MLKTKDSFVWKRSFSVVKKVSVEAGVAVEWHAKKGCYFVSPDYFSGILKHDAEYYGCRVDRMNVTGGSMEELKEIWKRLDLLGADTLIEKGYKYVIQFQEDEKNFGSPMVFKEVSHISSFMWENQKMKMKWVQPITVFLRTTEGVEI
jgi:hypothetical protein